MADTPSGHSQQEMSQLQYLVNMYNGIQSIPPAMLRNAGFKDQNDAFNAMTGNAAAAYNNDTFTKITNVGAKPAATIANAVIPLLKLADQVTAGTGLPTSNKPGLPGQISKPIVAHPVPTTQGISNIKDDYAAQYGQGSPGSGVQDVPPIAGGVQYGTPANGSLVGLPSVGTNSSVDPSTYQDPGINGGGAPNYSDYIANLGKQNYGDYADIPIAPKPYQFKINDFTDQAQTDASKAYGPAFQAIDLAKTNAQHNYDIANAVVGGLYADLGTKIAQSYNALDTKYDATTKGMKADTQAAQNLTNQAYGAGEKGIAAQLAAQGMGQYAKKVLAPNQADQAFQTGQIQNTGLAATTGNNEYKIAADTYGTGIGNAAATQGAFAQQGLATDLASTLSGFDQNKLNLSSDEAQKVLDLAQAMSGQDLTLQQMLAGGQQDYYQNQLAAANAQNQMVQSSQAAGLAQANQAYQNDYNAYEDSINNQLNAQKMLNQQNQFDASLGEQTREADQTNALGQAKINNTPIDPSVNPFGAYSQAVDQIMPTATGAQKNAYNDAIQNLIQTRYNVQGTQPTAQQFLKDLQDTAVANGLDPTTMYAIGLSFLQTGQGTGWLGAKAMGPLSTN